MALGSASHSADVERASGGPKHTVAFILDEYRFSICGQTQLQRLRERHELMRALLVVELLDCVGGDVMQPNARTDPQSRGAGQVSRLGGVTWQ
jgi:hypothetical protein